jgi:endoglycosylceramidase
MRFDARTGAFSFRYRPDLGIAAPTQVFVSPIHYPHGYVVRVENGRVTGREGRLLDVQPTSREVVTVRVVARRR